jgi:hypothetical protein
MDVMNKLFKTGYLALLFANSIAPAMNLNNSAAGEQLIEAVAHKDLKEVQRLIEAKADVNYVKKYDELATALIYAARINSDSIAQILIDAQADVNLSAGYGGSTPLHNAASYNNFAVAQLLIKNQADVNSIEPDGSTPLMWASARSSVKMVRMLIQAKADIHAKCKTGGTALGWAVHDGKISTIQLLIDQGSDIFETYDDGSNLFTMPAFDYYEPSVAHRVVIDRNKKIKARCKVLIKNHLKAPNNSQSNRIITFLLCMRQKGVPKNNLILFKAPLMALIEQENWEKPAESVAYIQIKKIENALLEKRLLKWLFKKRGINNHETH